MKHLFFVIAAVIAVVTSAQAQMSYRIGTIAESEPQGYHVAAVDIVELFPRIDFEQVTMTPWEFGELWVGFGTEWHIPKPRNAGAEFSLGIAFVNRVDRSVQLLKNWRLAVSAGVSF